MAISKEAQERINQIRAEREKLASSVSQRAKSLRDRLDTSEMTGEELRKALSDLESENARLSIELTQARQQVEDNEAIIQAQSNELEATLEAMRELDQEVTALEGEVTALKGGKPSDESKS